MGWFPETFLQIAFGRTALTSPLPVSTCEILALAAVPEMAGRTKNQTAAMTATSASAATRREPRPLLRVCAFVSLDGMLVVDGMLVGMAWSGREDVGCHVDCVGVPKGVAWSGVGESCGSFMVGVCAAWVPAPGRVCAPVGLVLDCAAVGGWACVSRAFEPGRAMGVDIHSLACVCASCVPVSGSAFGAAIAWSSVPEGWFVLVCGLRLEGACALAPGCAQGRACASVFGPVSAPACAHGLGCGCAF